MLGAMQRTDKKLLGRNLDRAMAIAAMLDGWSAARRAPLLRMLDVSLRRVLLKIESGEMTPEQAAERFCLHSGDAGKSADGANVAALVDELLLIFLTALAHDGSGKLANLREYTFRCVQRIASGTQDPAPAGR